jgi:hypothetical protein
MAGVSHNSALRPVKESRNFFVAPNVEEPVAMTRTLG